jgi:hypothetical protein
MDLISQYAALQKKDAKTEVFWWATTLAWRPTSSDLFLLVCYQEVFRELLSEFADREPGLTVWIEDLWLYHQLQLNFGEDPSVHFLSGGARRLWKEKARILGLGFAKRIRWLILTAYSSLLQKRLWKHAGWSQVPKCSEGIAIYSLPQPRCLDGETGWKDPYLADLDRVLESQGHRVFRFSPPGMPGFEQALAKRGEYFWPLSLNLKWSTIFRICFQWWTPRLLESPRLGWLRIDELIQREVWHDLGLASWCNSILFYECMVAFLSMGKLKAVVFPYENQPWEKMIALAAKAVRKVAPVKVVGCQHSTVPKNFLPYFLGKDERDLLPLPDVIMTSGDYTTRLLKEGGAPGDRLMVSGNLRYQNLKADFALSTKRPDLKKILVVLPLDLRSVRSMLGALKRAFPDFGSSEGLEFFLKIHPVFYHSKDEVVRVFPVTVLEGTFDAAMEKCGTVLSGGSTAGIEAWMAGRNTLRYRSELLIDLDPCEVLGPDEIRVCSDHNLRQQLLDSIFSGTEKPPSQKRLEEFRNSLFAPLSKEAIRMAILS